jgi:hypothetical protein
MAKVLQMAEQSYRLRWGKAGGGDGWQGARGVRNLNQELVLDREVCWTRGGDRARQMKMGEDLGPQKDQRRGVETTSEGGQT